jgi:hypothetical protein
MENKVLKTKWEYLELMVIWKGQPSIRIKKNGIIDVRIKDEGK